MTNGKIIKETRRLGVRGFTLIELLVVVSIIGLLSSVVLAALRSARNNATNARIKEEVISLRNQIELGFNGTYYTNLNLQYYTVTSFTDTAATNMAADIVKQSAGTSYGGGLTGGGSGYPDSVCGSTYNSDISLIVGNGSGCSYLATYSSALNSLSVFTDARCNQPKAFAIYAALQPVGSAGYFCADSAKNVVVKTTAADKIPADEVPGGSDVPRTNFTSIDSSGAGPQSHC